MRSPLPPSCPPDHPARLGHPDKPGLLYLGRAKNLTQRLDALHLVREAKVPSQQFPDFQDVDAKAAHYSPGLSKLVLR